MPTIKRKDRPAAMPRVRQVASSLAAWGRSPFGNRDLEEADGELVGEIRLHLGPDGRLYGVTEEPKRKDR